MRNSLKEGMGIKTKSSKKKKTNKQKTKEKKKGGRGGIGWGVEEGWEGWQGREGRKEREGEGRKGREREREEKRKSVEGQPHQAAPCLSMSKQAAERAELLNQRQGEALREHHFSHHHGAQLRGSCGLQSPAQSPAPGPSFGHCRQRGSRGRGSSTASSRIIHT